MTLLDRLKDELNAINELLMSGTCDENLAAWFACRRDTIRLLIEKLSIEEEKCYKQAFSDITIMLTKLPPHIRKRVVTAVADITWGDSPS